MTSDLTSQDKCKLKRITDKGYYRIELWVGKWKLHSAMMPKIQAVDLLIDIKSIIKDDTKLEIDEKD